MTSDGKVLHELALPIGGLLSDPNYEKAQNILEALKNSFKLISIAANFTPFLTLSLLTIPVILELKLTEQELFDFRKFDFIPLKINK